MARTATGRPRRLLLQVFLAASLITAVLSLDATVVLLTPVVFATTARLGARPKPHVYASTHSSNTASLLLPVSNLTNLLACAASGLSFTWFAALMALPWLAAIAVEYAVFRRFFVTDLDAGVQAPPAADAPEPPGAGAVGHRHHRASHLGGQGPNARFWGGLEPLSGLARLLICTSRLMPVPRGHP